MRPEDLLGAGSLDDARRLICAHLDRYDLVVRLPQVHPLVIPSA
jgi:hypothetical protein